MKKVIALFIASVMLFGAIPAAADTGLTIDTVRVTNVSAPLAGAKPDYTAYSDTNGMYLLDYSNSVCVNGVAWFDVEGDFYLKPDDTFVKGRIYEVRIHVVSNGVYKFAVDSDGRPAVKAYVNGYSVPAYSSVPSSVNGGKKDATRYLLLYYRFPACAASPVEYVPLLISEPVSGDHPGFSASAAILNAGFTVTADFDAAGFTNGVMWEVKNGDTYSKLAESDVFVAGRTYAVTIRIAAEAGRYFRLDTNGRPYATCKINGKNAYIYNSPVQSSPGNNAIITREFVCSARSIDSVSVTGTFTPESGGNPCFEAYPAGSGYQIKSVVWTDAANGETLGAKDTFVEDRTYMLEIALEPAEGCTFAGDVSGTLNGDTAAVNRDSSGIVTVSRYYVCPESKVISVVRVDDVTLPSRDGNPVYNASVSSDAKYTIDLSQDDSTRFYIKNGVQWADRLNVLRFDDTFNGGIVYFVSVFLAAKNGYRFDDYARATLNGYEADFVPLDYIDGEIAMIVLYCDKLPVVDLVGAGVMVTAPEAGEYAQFTAQPTSEGYVIDIINAGSFVNGVAWYDETGEKYLKQGDKFVKDHEYSVHVMIKTENEGYRFESASLNECIISGFVNGCVCTVEGAHDEADTRATLVYRFGENPAEAIADFDGNGKITSDDAVYLLRHTLFPSAYPVNLANPFYGKRSPTSDDAVYLLRYTLFPAQYDLFSYAGGAG